MAVRDDASAGCGCENVMKAGGVVGNGEPDEMRAELGDLIGAFSLKTGETVADVVDVWCVWPSE